MGFLCLSLHVMLSSTKTEHYKQALSLLLSQDLLLDSPRQGPEPYRVHFQPDSEHLILASLSPCGTHVQVSSFRNSWLFILPIWMEYMVCSCAAYCLDDSNVPVNIAVNIYAFGLYFANPYLRQSSIQLRLYLGYTCRPKFIQLVRDE